MWGGFLTRYGRAIAFSLRVINQIPNLVTKEMSMNIIKQVILVNALTIINLLFLGGLAAGEVKLVKGQTIYMPSYSNVVTAAYHVVLRANLIINNTDPNQSITIIRIDHYDTNGKLVEKYLSKPLTLGPLAATRVIIKKPAHGDEGAGANFVIQWRAQNLVTEPLMECIMVGSHGTQAYSFSSIGRVIYEEKN